MLFSLVTNIVFLLVVMRYSYYTPACNRGQALMDGCIENDARVCVCVCSTAYGIGVIVHYEHI